MYAKFQVDNFSKDLINIVQYSEGFLQGIEQGKQKFLRNLGSDIITILKEFIDSNARSNPEALHHVYEWYQTGLAEARLYEINYVTNRIGGLTFNYTFSQSSSIKVGSQVPFYDKARIMEEGIPVTIRPKNGNVLKFESGGEEIFTSRQVRVENPGGEAVQGSFQKVFDLFFNNYFSQSFLYASGLLEYLSNPKLYKTNFASGKKGGKSVGIKTGYTWITNAKMLEGGLE